MKDIIKNYIEYAKEKSNVDEVLNKKLISQNENFLKLKEYSKKNWRRKFKRSPLSPKTSSIA